MSSSKKSLSELEQHIMDAVWAKGRLTADEVRAALTPARILKDSTVRTVLRRLEEKGYVRHSVEGRTYLYQAADQPQRVAAEAVRTIIDKLCGGSVEALLVGLVDHEVVDRGELQALAQRIGQEKKAQEKSTKERK